jgi:FG-GAP-like repeat
MRALNRKEQNTHRGQLMKRCCRLLAALLLAWTFVGSAVDAQDKNPGKISWKKIVLDRNFRSEGVAVADVNKDGKLDVIVGDCWYEAPQDPAGAWKRHILRADRKFDLSVYSDSFCCFTDDFNGDGWPDVIVIPFPGNPCYWYENPGAKGGLWTPHLLTNSACNETPIYVDLFKTGKKYLVMGWNPQKDESDIKKGNYDDRGEMCYFVPGNDPTQPWQRISISGPSAKGKTIPGTARFSHGLGHGDVNGDGRIDIIVPQGWWEQPQKADGKPWKFHETRITDDCADMHTYDLDGDGKADIISTSAHRYGFWWSQQKDSDAFVQRSLFPTPADIARLPASPRFPFSDKEKGLFDAVSKIRVDHIKRAPFALDAELVRMARDHAERLAKSGDKEANIAGNYKGKVMIVNSKRFAAPPEVKKDDKKKDQLTPLQKFALALLPDNEKDADLLLPGFEIGIGAAKCDNGEMQYTLILGDRKQFSLPSQTHALHCIDIDGDGLKDLVTGRRWWAHGPRGDAGPNDPAYLYWFQAKKGRDGMISFTPHLIDDDSGIGTSFAVADMNGDGLLDIIVANKKGVHVFLQQR